MTPLHFRHAVFYIATAPRPWSGALTTQNLCADSYGVTTPRTQNPLDSFRIITKNLFFANNYYFIKKVLAFVSQTVYYVQRFGVVAQLVRASACHAEGRGFEPRQSRQYLHRHMTVFFLVCIM